MRLVARLGRPLGAREWLTDAHRWPLKKIDTGRLQKLQMPVFLSGSMAVTRPPSCRSGHRPDAVLMSPIIGRVQLQERDIRGIPGNTRTARPPRQVRIRSLLGGDDVETGKKILVVSCPNPVHIPELLHPYRIPVDSRRRLERQFQEKCPGCGNTYTFSSRDVIDYQE
jgi:hypothetical protein